MAREKIEGIASRYEAPRVPMSQNSLNQCYWTVSEILISRIHELALTAIKV